MTIPSIYLLNIFSIYSLFLLRVSVAVIFLLHGYPKINNLRQTWENFSNMGFKPGRLWGSIAAFLEFFGGTVLLLGLIVQPIAFFFVMEFLVILFWRIKNHHSFVGGWELDILILAAALTLVTLGGGAFTLGELFY